MTAKHSPATSLPWVTEKLRAPNGGTYYRCGSESDSGPVVQVFGTMSGAYDAHANAAYIVHAANAYPKLVEALRETLRDRLTQANLHQLPPGIRSRLESARALLRELGEAE